METNVNNKCKAFISLEQSKKLVEILSDDSADMVYIASANDDIGDTLYTAEYKSDIIIKECDTDYINCWSLAALLGVLPVSVDEGQHCLALINSNPNGDIEWLCCYEDCNGNLLNECYSDNPVDACYEMIICLHSKHLL